jgi:hypothetical protein
MSYVAYESIGYLKDNLSFAHNYVVVHTTVVLLRIRLTAVRNVDTLPEIVWGEGAHCKTLVWFVQ